MTRGGQASARASGAPARSATARPATARSPDPTDRRVGERVRTRRLLVGMSQTALGEAVGVTFQQIQKYENGTNRIGASRLHQIAATLGVPVTFFYEGEQETSAAPGDDNGGSDVSRFLQAADGVALMKAFVRVEDPKLRRRIVTLVQAMANQAEE